MPAPTHPSLTSSEGLELAVQRALRGEVPPCVTAIVCSTLSPSLIVLQVFHHGSPSQLAYFEETVASELEQCLPSGVLATPELRCELLPAAAFEARPGQLIIVTNPWAIDAPA